MDLKVFPKRSHRTSKETVSLGKYGRFYFPASLMEKLNLKAGIKLIPAIKKYEKGSIYLIAPDKESNEAFSLQNPTKNSSSAILSMNHFVKEVGRFEEGDSFKVRRFRRRKNHLKGLKLTLVKDE